MAGGLQDTRSSLLVGTPLYMAPEQLSSETKNITPATDVYALGVVLYELLTLTTPFEGATYVEVLDKLRNGTPRPVREVNPSVPIDLGTICAKCLEKDPADRYATAAEAGDDLKRFLAGKSICARPATWRENLARWRRQPQRIVTAGWFTCWQLLLSAAWMWIMLVAGGLLDAMPGQMTNALFDVTVSMATICLPLGLLGWAVMQMSLRAFWPAMAVSAMQLGAMIYSAAHEGVMFEYLYPTPFSKLASYTVLIMGSTMQLAMYLLAVPAWFRVRRSQGPSGGGISEALPGNSA